MVVWEGCLIPESDIMSLHDMLSFLMGIVGTADYPHYGRMSYLHCQASTKDYHRRQRFC